MTSASAPVSDLTLQELAEDPFAAYAAIRSLGRVVWVPALGRYAITRYDDIVAMDRSPQTFSTRDMSSPMVRSLGDMLMSKDGPPHRRERAAIEPSLRPRVIVDDWAPVFQRNADHLINGFVERGAVELDSAFGSRLAARNLADLLGLRGIEDETMLRWARAIVAGCGNYAQDEEVWLRNDAARGQITEAVAEVVAHYQRNPDSSLISGMLHASDPLTVEEISTNVGVLIAGGINEPNHALSIAMLGLLSHPEQRVEAESDESGKLWNKAFEEALRWVSPIGGYPRVTTQPVNFAGTQLDAGAPLIAMIAAANRDDGRYDRAGDFDIRRAVAPHLSFGSGSHMCLGAWMARVSIGQVAIPTLFRRLPGLRLVHPIDVVGQDWTSWMFRGLTELNVEWDTEESHSRTSSSVTVGITYVTPDGTQTTVNAPVGSSVMTAAVAHDVPGIVATCGGSMMCGTCHVYIEDQPSASLPEISLDEEGMLDFAAAERRASSRLSCQLIVTEAMDGLVVRVPDAQV